jgi:hypothetical protein
MGSHKIRVLGNALLTKLFYVSFPKPGLSLLDAALSPFGANRTPEVYIFLPADIKKTGMKPGQIN